MPNVPRKSGRFKQCTTLDNVRRNLQRVLRRLEYDNFDPIRAKALITGYGVMSNIVRGVSDDSRIAELEAAIQKILDGEATKIPKKLLEAHIVGDSGVSGLAGPAEDAVDAEVVELVELKRENDGNF